VDTLSLVTLADLARRLRIEGAGFDRVREADGRDARPVRLMDVYVPPVRRPSALDVPSSCLQERYKRLMKDLEELGLRHRRGHDLRRTMISLARTDGARRSLIALKVRRAPNSATR